MKKLFSFLSGPTPEKKGRALLGILTSETPDTEQAMALIKEGADLTLRDKSNNAALHYAVRQNLPQVVLALAEAGVDLDMPNNARETAFVMTTKAILAAGDNDTTDLYQMASLLADKKADINAPDREKRTALLQAIATGNEPLMQFLLARKANINAADSEGTTPLMAAVDREDIRIVNITLRAGAKPRLRDILGEEALASVMRKEADLKELLEDIPQNDPDYAAADKRRENLRQIRHTLIKAIRPAAPVATPASKAHGL